MTDREFLKAVKAVRRETLRRYGSNPGPELHADCARCKGHMLVAHLNHEVDFLEWAVKNP